MICLKNGRHLPSSMGVKNPFPIFYLMATIWGYPCFLQTKTYQIVDRPPIMGELQQSQSQKVPKYLGDLEYIYENMRYTMLSSNYDPGCTCFNDLPFWGSVTMGKPMACRCLSSNEPAPFTSYLWQVRETGSKSASNDAAAGDTGHEELQEHNASVKHRD